MLYPRTADEGDDLLVTPQPKRLTMFRYTVQLFKLAAYLRKRGWSRRATFNQLMEDIMRS